MKTLFFLLTALILSCNTFGSKADSVVKSHDSTLKPVRTKVYRINYFVEGSIIVVGMVGDLFAIPRLKNKAVLTDEELAFANSDQQKNLIHTVDKWALHQPTSDRALWKKISDDGEIGIFLLPSLLMIDKRIRKDWLRLLFMYVEGHTVTFTVYNYSPLGPWFQNRYRPAVYYPELGSQTQEESGNRNSFYSGHVASCAYSTFFMVKVYCDYHPEIRAWKYLLYLAASVPPLFMGYARIRSLDHFPSDVAVGFGLGAIIGIVIPALHKIPCSKYLSVNMATAPDVVGVSVCWNWTLPDKHLPGSLK
jgi:membrane-associated phospholipid phosphatase